MTAKEIGYLMFVIPACSGVAFVAAVCLWCIWDASKTLDDMEKHFGNPNSIKHRVHFFIFVLILICMIVGATLSGIS